MATNCPLGDSEQMFSFPQVPLGLSIAVSIRVGNELGAGNSLGAKRAAHAALGIICMLFLAGTVMSIALVTEALFSFSV